MYEPGCSRRLCVICEDAYEVVGANTRCSDVTDAGWNEEFNLSKQVAVNVEDLYTGRW